MIYAFFDLIFLPAFYKSGYKAGRAFVIASVPMLLGMIAAESAAHIPALAWLDSDAHWRRQLPVLLAGAACYAALLPLACRISERRFERVDL